MARPACKLDWKPLGHSTIEHVVSPYAYELTLPPTVHLHLVFHGSLLDPAPNDPVPGQLVLLPPTVMVDDVPEYEIVEIMNSKITRSRLKYYVKWTGYTPPTWDQSEFHANSAAVEQFHQKFPTKPGPRT